MIILGIETSCDETAISVLDARGGIKRPRFNILSNVVASQIKIHKKWGGVVPNLAKREHQRNLPIVLKKALKEAGLANSKSQIPDSKQTSNIKFQIQDINLIAVTVGPGLEPSLWTGINFALDLSRTWKKPIIGINHMEGHIVSVLLRQNRRIFKSKFLISKPIIKFPALALLVSGGHTELVLMRDWLKYKVIGQTRDDAAGEAFDKVARMLNLPYPGGPAISALSETITSKQNPKPKLQIKLPRPMINSNDFDFSFSGLKTAVLYLIRDLNKKGFNINNQILKAGICYEFQQAVIDVLISKTLRAAKKYKAKTIILGGGVAANQSLRKQLQTKIQETAFSNDRKYMLPVFLPEIEFTTDNAAMIATAAYFRALKKEFTNWKKLRADGNLEL